MSVLASRGGFVDAVQEHFDRAGIEYAFLHATEESEKDSDVDVIVHHAHLPAVEAVVRSGALGRLVQRMDYDIPWCRYYVLATGDPGRPFRQLDVASDPYGVSRYGLGLAQALEGARRVDGIPVLRPAARVVYLATKRARKGVGSPAEEDQLREAFEEDPLGARGLLVDVWGVAGDSVADALEAGTDVRAGLAGLANEVIRSRRTPRRLALRAGFEARRRLDRLRRPTGLVVQLVGPDGSGKSTMADGLERRLGGAFRRHARLHLGPGLLPPPSRFLGRPPADSSRPHGRPPSGRLVSLGRVAYLAVDELVGWAPRAWLPRAQSTLVVLERGWDDLRVDPARYRLRAGGALVRLLSRLMPRRDLTILLSGDARVIAERKPELSEHEVERQISAWREILESGKAVVHEVDTTRPEAEDAAATTITDHLRRRAGDLGDLDAARECLGESHSVGHTYSVVTAAGRPRWLLPRGLGRGGPHAVGLYRPASAKHTLGMALLDGLQRLGGAGFDAITLDGRVGLGPEIAAAIGERDVELACLLPTDPSRAHRATLSVLRDRKPIAIAKVALAGSPELGRERDVLTALAGVRTRALLVPLPLASFGWRRYDVLVTSLVPRGGGTDRALAATEERALVELAELTPHLEPLLGREDGRVLVHGDFTAWNSARDSMGRLALWDWEWARLGLPLEDYFHWQTQRLAHFGRGSVRELVTSAFEPTRDMVRLCADCGLEAGLARAPEALAASLHAGLATASREEAGYRVRIEALRLLGGDA